ncbi:hypothetical protein [Flavobacterium sp. LC2016-01]|uniref:hypothetical protein n=1 Tax=Flavobacterium sp. LC2016-01 TaxID=2675876 RepID=UPI001E332982|nr:hypothetical protein [Flavobacterium sp. LC2016-01]
MVRNPNLKSALAIKPTKKGLQYDYDTGTFQHVQDYLKEQSAVKNGKQKRSVISV